MFAKAPVPGRVKTRLARDVGAEAAAELQRAFLLDLGRRFSCFGEDRVDQVGRIAQIARLLACSPDPEAPVFEQLAELGWGRWRQGDGPLGVRLRRAFRRAARQGAERVVFLGSDSPTLPAVLVGQAFDALASGAEAVLGPGFDGGYYLVGGRTNGGERASTSRGWDLAGALFEEIPWGGPAVFSTTLRRLEARGIAYEVLPFWYDVDTLTALRTLIDHLDLRGPHGRIEAPETAATLERLRLAVS
jgi:rSAM/selenodomain-associated transferase 1